MLLSGFCGNGRVLEVKVSVWVDMQYMVNQLTFVLFHALKPFRDAKHANHNVSSHLCRCTYWDER